MEKDYDEKPSQYQFLKQYLTISRAEIFFAEKAILVEGDTEIILIPTLMKKIDIAENKENQALGGEDENPLLSQNISIIEVGSHSQIFEKFIDFLGIKSLVITDLDTVGKDGKKCEVSEGVNYSNTALSFFFKRASLKDLINHDSQKKLFNKINKEWVNKSNGRLFVAYQIKENGYIARSFEDAFIHLNKQFISDKWYSFESLKNRNYFDENIKNSYILARDCIEKKTHFALDILFNSDEDLSNWEIPSYIKEGLLWLKQD